MTPPLVEFKASDHSTLSVPILNYIKETYGNTAQPAELETKYSSDLTLLDQLRCDAVDPQVSDVSVQRLIEYYVQISLVSMKIPFEDGSFRIVWRWYSAFEKNRQRPATGIEIVFEQSCVLFNLAALYNQLGHQWLKSNSDSESLKRAANYFQSAAGGLTHVREKFAQLVQRCVVSADVSEPVLSVLITLNLAAAQECFYLKASLDQMKEGTISKLAAKASELFNSAYEQSIVDGAKSTFTADWTAYLQSRASYFGGISQFRKSRECALSNKYGEEVARLKASEILLKKSTEFKHVSSRDLSEYKKQLESIQGILKKAEKDNDIIYLEKIPDQAELSPIDKVQLANAIPFAELETFTAQVPKTFLADLYPFVVSHQISVYNSRKDNLVVSEKERLRKITADYQIALTNLGLPGALQAYEQPIGLPAELLQKSEEIRKNGGAQSLGEGVQTIQALAAENESTIQQIIKILDQEIHDEEECRSTFPDRWRRSSSITLQQPLRDKLKQRMDTFSKAKNGDALIGKKFADALPGITALSSSKEELEHSIPASSQSSAISKNDPVISKLKSVLKEGADAHSAREKLVSMLSEYAKDDKPYAQFLQNFQKKVVDYEPCIQECLGSYRKFSKLIDECNAKNQDVVHRLSQANQEFMNTKLSNEGIKQRQSALQNLDAAYSEFKKLQEHLNEGLKFHTEFSVVLANLNRQCSDYVSARSLEKKEMLKELTETVTSPPLPPRQDQPPSINPHYGAPQPQYPYAQGAWNPAVPIQYSNAPAPSGYYMAGPSFPNPSQPQPPKK